jgi:DNA-directed RNA polymerase subunit H
MATQNISSLITSVYNSRKTILNLMEKQDYHVEDYLNFSINEVNAMFQNKQLDMLIEKNVEEEDTKIKKKIYIKYYLLKTIRPATIHEMIDDLFHLEEILTKQDTLYIITKDEVNETLMNELKHIWEKDKIYIVLQNIKRLQFNILEHVLVPNHKIISKMEVEDVKKRYNIKENDIFPEISRFDPVAQAICIRPGEVCKIDRPSKTAIKSIYYRICV